MIYTTCKYAPLELFAGFNQNCERLDPAPASFGCAEGCGHANMCSFVKALLEEIETKKIRELILTDCCDSTRRLYDILKERNDLDFLWLLPFPHKHGQREIDLFARELQRLQEAYGEYCHIPFDREKVYADYAERQTQFPKRPQGTYIRLSGAHGGALLKKEIEEVFREIPVVDDTCTGNRYLRHSVDRERDFYAWYAEALLLQDMGCFRMWINGGRSPHGADVPAGTVFHTVKFCDYYGFEYMLEKDEIDGSVLKIETDVTSGMKGQLKTRLQAFGEEVMDQKGEMPKMTKEQFYIAGIDSGSTSTEAVILSSDGTIIAKAMTATGKGADHGAEKALAKAMADAGLTRQDLRMIMSTGYGRDSIAMADQSATEITCHARGAHYLNSAVRTIIDIGGQDSKVITINEKGAVTGFVMNDKCAAGTGRFLEMQARAMELSMEEMSSLGQNWQKDITISSMCTVFAESEVVSLVADNEQPADIIHGLNMSVARRTLSLIRRLQTSGMYALTGGVALNQGVADSLAQCLNEELFISPMAQYCGAIGAALLAREKVSQQLS